MGKLPEFKSSDFSALNGHTSGIKTYFALKRVPATAQCNALFLKNKTNDPKP
jgi:hypothetical protein